MCKEQDETVMHLASGCKMLCKKYTRRHDNIGRYIHWNILRDLGVKVTESWLAHSPMQATTKGETTIMWDLTIENCEGIAANRPDIVIWDRAKRTAQLIDVAVPMDMNVLKKYSEKLIKYRALEISVQKSWDLLKVRVVPVIIGALGTVCDGLSDNLHRISPNLDVGIIQKTALLGTSHVLRTVLK